MNVVGASNSMATDDDVRDCSSSREAGMEILHELCIVAKVLLDNEWFGIERKFLEEGKNSACVWTIALKDRLMI